MTADRTPLALHDCYCGDLALPHSHQLGDHQPSTDLDDVAAVLREQQRQHAAIRARHINRAAGAR